MAVPEDFIDIFSMADLEEVAFEFKEKKKKRLRVATKYVNLTREFFYSKGVTQFSIVKSIGSTEIAPYTGSSEVVTVITSTGSTLAANSLRIPLRWIYFKIRTLYDGWKILTSQQKINEIVKITF